MDQLDYVQPDRALKRLPAPLSWGTFCGLSSHRRLWQDSTSSFYFIFTCILKRNHIVKIFYYIFLLSLNLENGALDGIGVPSRRFRWRVKKVKVRPRGSVWSR